MHPPPQFIMKSKTYTDGVSLRKDGPQITKEFSTECVYDCGKTFRSAATFVPKLVPVHFVTTLTVADQLTYYESVAFERRTVMRNFSETTNIFLPKEKTNRYCSSVFFDPDVTTRCYVTGVELLPERKFVVVNEKLNCESDATEFRGKNAINGDIECQQLTNGGM